MHRVRLGVSTLVAAVTILAGCGGEPTGQSARRNVDEFFTAVYAVAPGSAAPIAGRRVDKQMMQTPPGSPAAAVSANIDGVLRTGDFPLAPAGPTATLSLGSSVIATKPAKFLVSASAPFTKVNLFVTTAAGYWEVVLPQAVTEVQIVAIAAATAPFTEFGVATATGTDAGYGTAATQLVRIIDLSDADVAVVLTWNKLADVDLHVTGPDGVEIYFGNAESAAGGKLDLDSNAACDFDGINQEVISWPASKAPPGEYRVSVYYWSDCGQTQTDYTVTTMVKGETRESINGNFIGSGSPSTGREVTTFNFP